MAKTRRTGNGSVKELAQPPSVPVPQMSPANEIQRAYDQAAPSGSVIRDGQINRSVDRGIEFGGSGLKRWGGRVYQEFLPELRGQRGMRVYDEMRKSDAVIGSVLTAIKASVRSVSWKSVPADESEEAKRWSVFLEQNMDDMHTPWMDFISDVLTMVPFGWSLFEAIYKVRAGEDADQSSNYNDGLIGWDDLAFRAQDSLYIWDIDNAGRVHGMVQMPAPDFRQRYLPFSKCVLFRTEHEANNPEGFALLRNCYRAWYYKKNLEEVEGIGIERDFTGMMVVTLPMNATNEDHNVARSILEKAKSDEMNGVKLQRGPNPDGRDDWDIKLLSSPGNKSIDVDKAILRYSGEIATAFLAQFLRLGQGGGQASGSYALSRSHKDFFYLAVQALVDIIAETCNSWLVTPLMRLNNVPVDKRPMLSHGRIAPREIDSLISAIDVLSRDGLLGPVDERFINFLRGEMDVPEAQGNFQEWFTEQQRIASNTGPQSPTGPVGGSVSGKTG